MTYGTVIDPQTLHAHRDDPEWVIVDCRFNLMDTEAGRRAYRENHIPGARHAHLDEDLSGPITPPSGRHPLPDPQRLARTLGAWGITENTQVVAYDDMNNSIAARLWWLLGWLGHARRAVLDGGLAAWRQLGLPLGTAVPTPVPQVFPARPDDNLWVNSATVLKTVVHGAECLLDARAPARFRGEQEPIDPVAGHIPKALNRPFDSNLDGDGRFLPPAVLRTRYAALLQGREPRTVLHMCGSGVTACHNLLAMEIAGLSGSRLYVGSWSEWIRDPARPIATGEH
jgi:thiosulfate/3-mercaptopyruvate sulfurtransferase